MTPNIQNMTYTYTGTAGQVYNITNGTAGWVNGSISVNTDLSSNTLDVKGDANFEGDLKVKGKSIIDSLNRIEERLAILHPNTELEEKWDKLRGLRQAYIDLEAEIREKEKVWAIIKK